MIRTMQCNLITKTYAKDSIGQPIENETPVPVPCNISSVSASEFMDAGQIGIKPDFRVSIWSHEYGGQDEIEVSGVRYSVYRTYENSDGRIELYVQRKVGVSNES